MRPLLGAWGHWVGREPIFVARDLGFCALIRRTVPFSRLERQTKSTEDPYSSRGIFFWFRQSIISELTLCFFSFILFLELQGKLFHFDEIQFKWGVAPFFQKRDNCGMKMSPFGFWFLSDIDLYKLLSCCKFCIYTHPVINFVFTPTQ